MRKKSMRAVVMGSCAMFVRGASAAYHDTDAELKAKTTAQRQRLAALAQKLKASIRATEAVQAKAHEVQVHVQKVQQAQADLAKTKPAASSGGLSYQPINAS